MLDSFMKEGPQNYIYTPPPPLHPPHTFCFDFLLRSKLYFKEVKIRQYNIISTIFVLYLCFSSSSSLAI